MTRRSLLLLAVLVYVTLDLSFPAMPGAFVFEPEDSAEGTQVRARSAEALPSIRALQDSLTTRPGLL